MAPKVKTTPDKRIAGRLPYRSETEHNRYRSELQLKIAYKYITLDKPENHPPTKENTRAAAIVDDTIISCQTGVTEKSLLQRKYSCNFLCSVKHS
jgi:hypothetical protein